MSGCSYVSLSNYNGPKNMSKNFYGSSGVPSTAKVVIPEYGTYGYTTLTHGLPEQQGGSCGNYFDLTRAYGRGAENCSTASMQRMCNQ